MNVNLERFEAWLRSSGYAESSIRLSLTEAKQIARMYTAGEALPSQLKWTGKRMIAAGVASGQLATQITTLGARKERQLGGRRHKPRRKHDARSMGDDAWKQLHAHVIATRTDEARVIEVVMAHGKRIGDVLRVERDELRRAIKTGILDSTQKGGRQVVEKLDADDAWRHLWDAWQGDKDNTKAPNVAGWLCPTNPSALPGSGAYKRVARALKKLCAEAGNDERVFLHRLRRTVAVQALRLDKDVGAVQQMLGHASPHTTMLYIDEARPDDVAELGKRVRKKFREE